MGMTVTEKIIARAAGVEQVTAGDFINASMRARDKPKSGDPAPFAPPSPQQTIRR